MGEDTYPTASALNSTRILAGPISVCQYLEAEFSLRRRSSKFYSLLHPERPDNARFIHDDERGRRGHIAFRDVPLWTLRCHVGLKVMVPHDIPLVQEIMRLEGLGGETAPTPALFLMTMDNPITALAAVQVIVKVPVAPAGVIIFVAARIA